MDFAVTKAILFALMPPLAYYATIRGAELKPRDKLTLAYAGLFAAVYFSRRAFALGLRNEKGPEAEAPDPSRE